MVSELWRVMEEGGKGMIGEVWRVIGSGRPGCGGRKGSVVERDG